MGRQYRNLLSAIYEVAEGMSPSEIRDLKEEINNHLEHLYVRALDDELYTEDDDEPWWNK